MFTRRHYQAIAEILKIHRLNIDGNSIYIHFADFFAKDNPRFDRDRFFAACGIEVDDWVAWRGSERSTPNPPKT